MSLKDLAHSVCISTGVKHDGKGGFDYSQSQGYTMAPSTMAAVTRALGDTTYDEETGEYGGPTHQERVDWLLANGYKTVPHPNPGATALIIIPKDADLDPNWAKGL